MLGLISSLVFAVYAINVTNFWERAEVFLGVFPLIVVFKMSAQGKLPRVGYPTAFDNYASACQVLFFVIVISCLAAPPQRLCNASADAGDHYETMRKLEPILCCTLALIWLGWNAQFAWRHWRVQQLEPLEALRVQMKPQLQDTNAMGRERDPSDGVGGLASRLSALAISERSAETGETSRGLGRRSSIVSVALGSSTASWSSQGWRSSR